MAQPDWRRVVWGLLAVWVVVGAGVGRADMETLGGVAWGYVVEDGAARVTNASPVGAAMEIPAELGGCPVTMVGDRLFEYSDGLEAVTIPGSVTRIGGLAFYRCSALQELVIPDSVEHIGLGTFLECTALVRVTVGSGLKDIDKNAFSGCNALEAVHVRDLAAWCGIAFANLQANPLHVARRLFLDGREVAGDLAIPDGLETIALGAFYGCSNLTSVAFLDGVKGIGGNAFEECSGLTNVVLGAGMENVGTRAFRGCGALTGVAGGGGVTNLGDEAFANGSELVRALLPDGLKSIGSGAFNRCSALTEVTLPEGVESVGENVFGGCVGLTNVVLSGGLARIGDGMFSGCTGLAEVTVPEGATRIGSEAFSECTGLREVEIPGTLRSVGNGAFAGCDALEAVRVPDLAAWCRIGFGDAEANPLRRAKVFAGGVEVGGDVAVPESVERIGARAFCGCGGLTAVSIPAGVANIGEDAFADCPALASIEVAAGNAKYSSVDGVLYDKAKTRLLLCPSARVGPCTIPEGVGTIADHAFEGCTGLTAVTLPGSVTNIGAHAFAGCTGLREVALPEGLAGLGEYAFANCAGLESVVIPGSVREIGMYAFEWCTGLVSVVVAEGVENIGHCAFERCGALVSVSLPDTVTNIGALAFGECVSLVDVTIPGSVAGIGKSAFQGCRSLESVAIPPGVEQIAQYAFYACTSLKSVSFPDGLKILSNYAFGWCTSLEAVVLPDGVTTLGNSVFLNCAELKMVVCPPSLERIGIDVFRGCDQLARVYLSAAWQGTDRAKLAYVPTQALVYGEPPETWETAERPGPPEISPGAGAWPEAGEAGLEVALSSAEGATVYYTLDGSRPVWLDGEGVVHWSATAKAYSGPLRLRNGLDTGAQALSTIMTGKNEGDAYDPWYAPAEPPLKIPVLRAAAVGADGRVGEVATATYLLGDAATRYGATPVVSLCAEWADFFDNTHGPGIYRYPTAADKAKVANAHVEFFAGGARQFAKWCELKAQGGTTLGRPKKSLRLTGWKGWAPSGKGKKEAFDYPFFGDAAGRRHSSIVLRMGGNDWNRAVLRDRLAQEIGADETVDGEAGATCVLFLDGVYWGVHELRERHDAGWFKERLGIGNKEAFSLLEYGDKLDYPQVNEGWGEDDEARTSEAYADFWAILRQLEAWGDDLADAERWAWFTNRVDPDSLAAHFAASLFVGNSDWPWNNQQWWRAWPEGAAGGAVDRSRPRNDGRWNWTFHDMDFAFALPFDYVPDWNDGLRAAHDSYTGIHPGEGPYAGTWVEDASRVFRAAMTNPGFRDRFLARVYLRLATDWSPGACVAALERVADELRGAGMYENGARWRQPQTATDWERQIDVVRGYLRARPEAFAWHTRRRYGLGATRTVVLGTDGEGEGSVRVAGRGVEWAALPLRGGFPCDLPLELEAVPAAGSSFAGWFAVPGLLPEKAAARAEDCAANYGGEGGIFPTASLGTGWGPWTQEGGFVFVSSSAMPIHGRSEVGRSFGISDSDYGGAGSVRRKLADGAVLAVGEEMSVDVGFGCAGGNGGAGVSFTAAGGAEEPVRLALAKDGADGEAFRLTLDGQDFIAENFPHLPGAPVRVVLARTGESDYALRLERGGEAFGTEVRLAAEIAGVRLWKNPYGDKAAKWTLWFDNLRVAAADAGAAAEPLETGVLRPVAFYETGADLSRWSRSVRNRAAIWVETAPLCNIGTPAFGMSSGEGSEAVLRRRFGFALTNGYELSFDFQNNDFVGPATFSSACAGAVLLTESGESFTFYAERTNATYRLRVAGGEPVDTGVPLVKTGVRVTVAPREGGGVAVTVAGRAFVLDAASAIDGIEFFDRTGGEEKLYHVFFNRVTVRCAPGTPLPPPPPEPVFSETGADRANWTFWSNPGSSGGWAGGGAEDSRILGVAAFYLYAGGPDRRDTEPFAEAWRMFPDGLEFGEGAVLAFRFAHGAIGDESITGIGAVGWNLLDAEGRSLATFSALRDYGGYFWNGTELHVSQIPDTPHDAEIRFRSATAFDLWLDGVCIAEDVALEAPVRGLRFWNAKAGSGQARNLLFNDIAVYLPAAESGVAEPAARRRSAPREAGETLLSADRVWTLVPSNDIAVVARFVPRAASDLDLWAADRGIDNPWAVDSATGRSPAEDYLLETNGVSSLHDFEDGAYTLRFTPGEHGIDADVEVATSLPAADWHTPAPGELPEPGATNAPTRLFIRLLLRPAE